ncbi:unnamed protein product [Gongylonema pulchrum]|uniref:Piwi domain-containing protein n=1 Tax=Gongylonema pulchrum TaxID=637853 RepID=A0A183EEQ3_9BILA|nr:unnamed protein product [Gongylonema pulchrum]
MEPKLRKERIELILNDQDLDNDVFLKNYNVKVEPDMIHLNGRVLDAPKLELDPYRNLTEACLLFGMTFLTRDPLLAEWNSHREDRGQLRAIVRQIAKDCQSRFGNTANLHILFLMQKKHAATYGTIKTACDVEEGVACQVVLTKTLLNMRAGRPETNSTAHNIIMKMNTKLGGVNNKVHQSYNIWPKFSNPDDPTLFVGVDVTHPRPGKRANSIATVVGSVNLDATRYETSIKVQHPQAERIVYLVDALKERLLAFYKAVGTSPKHIVIYRDGISETEFLNTLKEELASVKAACRKLDSEYSPTVSYIVVQKRHHTRFFAEPSVASRFGNLRECKGNIPPGTTVDMRVTSSHLFDFFLCSHLGAIGTSRPSHYYVLYDSWNLTPDEWQHLTFALCHVYARCNRSVSIPAPVYYAHLACARASIHDDALFGIRGSTESRDAAGGAPARSEQETTRTHQMALCVNEASPRMYFV